MPVRVLIAEEHEECRQLFRRFLLRCGFEVSTAKDGLSCTDALQQDPRPDVLILSWELPWGDGSSVCKWLEAAQTDSVAVVVLTARMDPNSLVQEASLPRITWVQRPFRLMELLHAVQSAERISRRSWRCLENLWRKTTRPFNGILLESHAVTHDLSDAFLAADAESDPCRCDTRKFRDCLEPSPVMQG